MPAKNVQKFFEKTLGIDKGSHALSRNPNALIEMMNCGLSPTGSIEGRPGFSPVAVSSISDTTPSAGLYLYKGRTLSGGTLTESSEIIGLANNTQIRYPYKKVQGRLRFTTGATVTPSFHVYNDSGTWKIDLRSAGVTVGGVFPWTPNWLTDTLATLRDKMNTVWTTALSPGAVVLTTGTVSRNAVIAVENTYATGKQPPFITVSTEAPTRAWVKLSGTWRCVDVLSASSSGVALKLRGSDSFTVTAGDEIGVGQLPLYVLGYQNLSWSTGGSVRSVYFDFWEEIFGYSLPTDTNPTFADALFSGLVPPTHPPTFVTINNTCYISTHDTLGADPNNASRPETGLLKYDGHNFIRAGMPQAPVPSLAAGSGTGLTGVYKYVIRYKFIDHQGVFTFGNDSAFSGDIPSIQAAGTDVEVTVSNITSMTHMPNSGGKFSNGGTQTGTSTTWFTVDQATNDLRVGDMAAFLDSSGVLQRARVTAIQDSSTSGLEEVKLNVSGSVTVADDAVISNNLTIEIYRTKAGGTLYYLAHEIPNTVQASTTVVADSVADANLGAQYEGTSVGQLRRDMPPPMHMIESHQGLLVGAQSTTSIDSGYTSQTVHFSNAESPEYFPAGTNSFACVGSLSGGVSAIAAEDGNNLLVFKDHSYFAVNGSLADFAFTVTEKGGGNLGCPAPCSIQRVANAIAFLSEKGPRFIVGGEVLETPDVWSSYFTPTYAPDVTCEDGLPWSTSVIDQQNRLYIIFLPTYPTRALVYDITEKIWSEWSLPYADARGGCICDGTDVYLLGSESTLEGYPVGALYKSNNYGNAYDWADNGHAISQYIQSQWDSSEDPRQDREFKEFSFFCLPERGLSGAANTGEEASCVSSTFKVYAYRNFSKTSLSGYVSKGVALPQYYYDVVLPFVKATAFSFKILVDTAFQHLFVSGYQYYVSENTRRDRTSFE